MMPPARRRSLLLVLVAARADPDWCEAATTCPDAGHAGRCNLDSVWDLVRAMMPNACTLVDVGANKGLVSARWLELWRPEARIDSTSGCGI